MKSIKPGRGPSMMGGIASVAVGLFGVFWVITAASMGAPGPFVFFGIIFIGLAIAQAIYNFNNATTKNRMSIYDITDNEPDPLDSIYGKSANQVDKVDYNAGNKGKVNYCPNCGQGISGKSYNYCPSCGQELSTT